MPDLDDLLTALTRSWDAIRARHEEVPPVVLVVGSHRREAKLPCLGGFVTARWSPAHAGEPPELQALREEFDDAIARGDLVAALAASSEMLLRRAMQLSADATRIPSPTVACPGPPPTFSASCCPGRSRDRRPSRDQGHQPPGALPQRPLQSARRGSRVGGAGGPADRLLGNHAEDRHRRRPTRRRSQTSPARSTSTAGGSSPPSTPTAR